MTPEKLNTSPIRHRPDPWESQLERWYAYFFKNPHRDASYWLNAVAALGILVLLVAMGLLLAVADMV